MTAMRHEELDPVALAARVRRFWYVFCHQTGLTDTGVPLFRTKDGKVLTGKVGKSKREVLARSQGMEALVLREVTKVKDDFDSRGRTCEGLLFIVYTEDEEAMPEPLHIGSIPKIGPDGGYNKLLKGIKAGANQHAFAGWGYNKTGFFGGLSALLVDKAGIDPGGRNRFTPWVKRLFLDPPVQRKLRQPVHFWARAWDPTQRGPWMEYGPCGLAALELQLEAIAAGVWKERLLD
ncbi:MAG: hypothetical protein ACYTGX_19705 [Planctomycetota bacterium]|jgi:hypothetical protein